MQVQAYLNFNGRCEEALEFYRKAIGAEVGKIMRWKDAPMPTPPGNENKVMHTTFRIGDTEIMASDGRCEGNANFQGFNLSVNLKDEGKVERLFNALADGGQVTMPLEKTFFSPKFGMVTDRFGMSWMIHMQGPVGK